MAVSQKLENGGGIEMKYGAQNCIPEAQSKISTA